jgi:flagellar biosynthesis/type III secretory pathway protein FliH
VRYVTSFEQMAIEKGMKQGMKQGVQQGLQQGLQQGVQQGLQQGMQQGVRDAVVKVLRVRFKRVPKLLLKKINLLQDPEKLSQLLEEAVLVKSLAEFEPHLD